MIGIPVFSRNFDQSAYWGSSTFVDMSVTTSNSDVWNYSPYAVSDVIWDNTLRIPVNSETRPQGAIDIIAELQSLRDTVTDLSGNPYTDFLLGQVGENGQITTTHSPAVYDEETLVFTEPVTGTQYQTKGWTYDYKTRCYDLELEPGTFLIGDSAIDQILLTYADEGLTLDYRAAGVSVQLDEFAYVVAEPVAEGSCTHTYTSETLSQSTCATAGVVRQTCSLCGGVINETLPLASHTYSYETITAPSCLLPGERTGTCTVCAGETVETLPALGHNWRLVQRVPTQHQDDDETKPIVDYTHDLYQCPTCLETYKDYALEGVPANPNVPDVPEVEEGLLADILGAVQSLSTQVVTGISSLFIPNEAFFAEAVPALQATFQNRMGLLTYPLSIMVDFLGQLSDISAQEPILRWDSIYIFNTQLIAAGSYNLNDALGSQPVKQLHDMYLVLVDACMTFAFLELCRSKYRQIVHN